jgi:hypothetical protein
MKLGSNNQVVNGGSSLSSGDIIRENSFCRCRLCLFSGQIVLSLLAVRTHNNRRLARGKISEKPIVATNKRAKADFKGTLVELNKNLLRVVRK